MSTIRAGIKTFLDYAQADSPYLIPKWSVDFESQFLVHPGNETVDGANDAWTDGIETWCNHRWPHKAGTDPYYRDKKLTFSPMAHLKRMGSTWWNFKTKRSVAVALDIDLQGEHAEGTTTVTPEKLEELVAKLKKLDYLTLVRSSGGGGVHVYSFFNEDRQPKAENHNEHAQVGHALVAKISEDLSYNFRQHMDAVGVVFWFWSCDSPAGHPGYELLKEQTAFLTGSDLAPFMGANLAGPNKKRKITGYTDSGQQVTNTEEGGGYKTYDLDATHSEILKELEDLDYDFIWVPEYNMVHTSTRALKELFEKRKAQGRPLKGMFKTTSVGEVKKPNCFMTPRPNGVFQVKRFGNGVGEHPLWNTRDGDTWCYLNQEAPVLPLLKRFASNYDGVKLTFEAQRLEDAMQALDHTLGESIKSISVPIHVVIHKDGTLLAQFKSDGHYEGWHNSQGKLMRELPVVHKAAEFTKSMLDEADAFIRNVITPDNEPFGWALRTRDAWIIYRSFDPIKTVLKEMYGKDANALHAEMTMNPWMLTHEPFGKEYPGGRLWNKHAPQLMMEPASEPGPHPHWDMIFDHLGKTLNDTVQGTDWCSQWGLYTGADYLRAWVAAMIQDPFEPLPYLFFYGPQDTGKSVFHESISLLFTSGIVSISTALASSAGYNAEVANAILGFIEEKDLSAVKDTAYTKIKEWTTCKTMVVHRKGHTPYNQPNTLHMCHMANKATACPMEDGDTRITAILVEILEKIIPKKALFVKLEEEAPFFLRTVMTTHLPESHTRLRVPMLATQHKKDLEEMHQTPFETFASENLYSCNGQTVKFADFYAKYREFCALRNAEPEKKSHVLQMLRNRADKWTIGVRGGKQYHIANVSMDPSEKAKKALKLNDKGRLVHV
jgi:hypothetical protein